MQEALAYLSTLALFSFVILGTARMRHELLLLACIPPMFVALIVGFVMTLYAGSSFGYWSVGVALLIGAPPAWGLARRLQPRDLLIAIYLGWAVALLLALIAFSFPDRPE